MDGDRGLKDIAIRAAGDHVKELVDKGEFVGLCKEKGEIVFDVLKASLTSQSNSNLQKACIHCSRVCPRQNLGRRYYCNYCLQHFY
jgi:hypothetical protein